MLPSFKGFYRRIPVLIAIFALPFGTPDAWGQTVYAPVHSTESVISYTGSATLHDWTGTSDDVSGQMLFDLDHPENSRVLVRAPVASFVSGPDRRDRNMREVTEVDTYPTVKFRATDIRPTRWGRSSSGHAGEWSVTGDLTFHGQTHPVEATVDVQTTDDSVHAHAEFPVSLTRFGVERPELLWVAPIADTIRIDAQIQGGIKSMSARASRIETTKNEVTGTRQIASTKLRDVTVREYDGNSARFRADVRFPSDGPREWTIAFYGFTDQSTGLEEAQTVTVQADGAVVDPRRIEGSVRQVENGTTVEIVRLYFSRSEFESIAQALSVTTTIGPARFALGWAPRQDMRLILEEVAPAPSEEVSTREEN